MQIKLNKKSTNIISRINKINGWQNRAVYGTVALLSQPFFDFYNPSVDKKTQKYSLVKTLIKIVVGTTVGIASRAAFQKWGHNLAKKGFFIPKNLDMQKFDKDKFARCVGNTFAIMGATGSMLSVDTFASNKLLSYFNKKLQARNKHE